VPKFITLRMEPASGSALPPGGGPGITQSLWLTNTQHGAKELAVGWVGESVKGRWVHRCATSKLKFCPDLPCSELCLLLLLGRAVRASTQALAQAAGGCGSCSHCYGPCLLAGLPEAIPMALLPGGFAAPLAHHLAAE
jgi:hypothetical protein